jgi:beta-N-acetylhexosaminidase
MKPVIFGLSGPTLTAHERDFFRDCDPAGYILFKHNVVDRDQLRALTSDLRLLSGRTDLPILIDQEGGRVQRMGPPNWSLFPSGARFADLYERAPMSALEAARANAEAMALMLHDVGITVDCAPVLDIRNPHTHDAIGDRAYGTNAVQVASLGRAVLDGLQAGGVLGVVKHMPGQGRAAVDSHEQLPVVTASVDELEEDVGSFKRLNTALIGMTGHVLFKAWDEEHCATMSPTIIHRIIRDRIGFDGLLLSDDLAMKALKGGAAEKACGAVAAGCDIALNCRGSLEEFEAVAGALPDMQAATRGRLDRAMSALLIPKTVDKMAALIAKRDALLAYAT